MRNLLSPSFRTVLVSVLVAAVAVNIVQLPFIETSGSAHIARPPAVADLAEAAATHGSTTRRRHLVYLQLGEVAAGSRLVIFPGLGMVRDDAYGLGRLAAVEVGDYAPTIGAGLAGWLADQAQYTGEDRNVGPYVIVVPSPVPEVVAVTDGEVTFFVARSLLPAGVAR